ncbi:MAG TPA: DUF2071 domain-containing protein [Bryobacteraceae bacterium]|nr:DUF2071 domain-containing protein [Bryobacteraceae bacterium]
MYQRWPRLTFLHWRYDPQLIRRLIPEQLTLDTAGGAAWVGLVPFEVADLHPPWAPSLPWISHFPETNVRTYVRGPGGQRGVWFFTLEADRLPAVIAARTSYHLPYRWASMRVWESDECIRYTSERCRFFWHGHTDISVKPGEPMMAGQLDNFLTARFWLFSTRGKRVYAAPIEHKPWPLQSAKLVRLEENLVQNLGLPPRRGEPLIHYSADLQVKIGAIQRVG